MVGKLELVAKAIFVIGAAFYVASAVTLLGVLNWYQGVPHEVMDADDDATWWEYYNKTGAIPDYVLEAAGDDDETWSTWYSSTFMEDDYIFEVETSRLDSPTPVSQFMALYFAATACFLLMGLLEMYIHRSRMWMVLLYAVIAIAAGLGLTSAMLTEKNNQLSTVFNCVSVHLFALAALIQIYLVLLRRSPTGPRHSGDLLDGLVKLTAEVAAAADDDHGGRRQRRPDNNRRSRLQRQWSHRRAGSGLVKWKAAGVAAAADDDDDGGRPQRRPDNNSMLRLQRLQRQRRHPRVGSEAMSDHLYRWEVAGSLCFLSGTLMDMVTSYFYLFGQESVQLGMVAVVAAVFWMVAALCFTAVTGIEYRRCHNKNSTMDDANQDDRLGQGHGSHCLEDGDII